jgi:DNA-binding FrmR family transcriptional regulator
MSMLADTATRTDLLNRLKRAEGQLRGIQRMIEEGQPCLDIASQMAAVRKALDSTYVRMTVCFMQQELQPGCSSTSEGRRARHPAGRRADAAGQGALTATVPVQLDGGPVHRAGICASPIAFPGRRRNPARLKEPR